MPAIKNRIRLYFKGSLKDPSIYFGAFSVILVATLILSQILFLKSSTNKEDFLLSVLVSEQESRPLSQNHFISQNKGFLPEYPKFLLIERAAVLAVSPPQIITPQTLGAIFLSQEPEEGRKAVIEYIVEQGDTLSSLAAKFNVSTDTILWANNLSKNSTLKVGQKLVILPLTGVIHHVKDKDTISGIAEIYKVKAEEIIAFNELSSDGRIYIGDILIIPGGKPPSKPQPSPISQPLADNYFICPTASCAVSQGLHWYNAIDFQGNCGDPIRAAAASRVLKVALTNSTSRYAFGGAGNHLTLLHPNGVLTMYGHIASSLVNPGDNVSQGDIIAFIGGKPGTPGAGLSTGCHVHFGVQGARNPFNR